MMLGAYTTLFGVVLVVVIKRLQIQLVGEGRLLCVDAFGLDDVVFVVKCFEAVELWPQKHTISEVNNPSAFIFKFANLTGKL